MTSGSQILSDLGLCDGSKTLFVSDEQMDGGHHWHVDHDTIICGGGRGGDHASLLKSFRGSKLILRINPLQASCLRSFFSF